MHIGFPLSKGNSPCVLQQKEAFVHVLRTHRYSYQCPLFAFVLYFLIGSNDMVPLKGLKGISIK